MVFYYKPGNFKIFKTMAAEKTGTIAGRNERGVAVASFNKIHTYKKLAVNFVI